MQVHIEAESKTADHCRKYALGDEDCDHTHTDFQLWNWYHEHYSIVQSQTRDIRIVFLQDKFQNTVKLILELFQGYLFEWKMPVLI
jgi:hypothetical protein